MLAVCILYFVEIMHNTLNDLFSAAMTLHDHDTSTAEILKIFLYK